MPCTFRLLALLLFFTSVPVAAIAGPIHSLVGQVSMGQYQDYQWTVESMGLGLYGGAAYNQGYRGRDGTAGPGSLGNQETRLYLSDTFAALGLNVNVQGSYRNVVAELPGVLTPGKVYIICGHYDHVGGDRPGGDDNASGTAGVLEAARVLSQYQFESTIRFIGFNAEEDNLLGSKDYVNSVVVPGGENIAGVINLDMILRPGFDSNPAAVVDLDLSTGDNPSCNAWADAFRTAAETYATSLVIDANTDHYPGGSDHYPFVQAGYPACLAIENTANEIWGGANAYYHGPNDASDGLANDPTNPSGVVYDYLFATDVVRASVALLAQEAALVPEPSTLLLLVLGVLGAIRLRCRP